MKKVNHIVLYPMVLGFGLLMGSLFGGNANNARVDGRLSACKDIMSIVQMNTGVEFQCVVERGDVWITSPVEPNIKISLDGKKVRGN